MCSEGMDSHHQGFLTDYLDHPLMGVQFEKVTNDFQIDTLQGG
jgi:hypothetical protein